MDDLNEKLTQLLHDPGSLKQIMDLAAALGGQTEHAELSLPADLPEQLGAVLQEAQRHDVKQEALVNALLPYLRPTHQARLERAVQIAHLSKLAASAWKNAGFKEALHV